MQKLCVIFFLGVIMGCQNPESSSTQKAPETDSISISGDTIPLLEEETGSEDNVAIPQPKQKSTLEISLIDQGLVDIQTIDSTILADIKYSTTDNFLYEDVYGDFEACYLQKDIAEKLSKASQLLQKANPEMRLIVFDCVRPRSVQYKMWDIVKETPQQKYVAYPGGKGSIHNYGAAIDLGLYHIDTGLVDMGTPFDFFGDLAQPRYEKKFLESGELSELQVSNRRLLRYMMIQAGFHGILSEWWHFNGVSRELVREKYSIVE